MYLGRQTENCCLTVLSLNIARTSPVQSIIRWSMIEVKGLPARHVTTYSSRQWNGFLARLL
jgi:hypothetical protein